MRLIGSINENEWKGKPAQRLGTSWFSRLCLRRRAGGSAERTLSAGILFRKHILMQNVLPAVSDRPIQPEPLSRVRKWVKLANQNANWGAGVQSLPNRGSGTLPLPSPVTRSKASVNRLIGTQTGVQGVIPCLPLPRVRKWVKLASWNANWGSGALPLGGYLEAFQASI